MSLFKAQLEKSMSANLPCKHWTTVRLGAYKTPAEYIEAITAKGVRCGPMTTAATSHLTFSGEVRDVRLTMTNILELGIDSERGYSSDARIMDRYGKQGLSLCTQEMILALAVTGIAVPLVGIEYAAEWFVAPDYKIKKGAVVLGKDNKSYCLSYHGTHLTVCRTGSGTHPTNGGGAAYGKWHSIVIAME